MNATHQDARVPVVSAKSLTKRFGDFTAVAGIDFEVAAGEAFGFLGPNGAGKTSSMRMIACASPSTSGELRVLGMDPATQASNIKARLGVVPQIDNLDKDLTVTENLQMYARYFDIPKTEAREKARELLEFVQLTERADDQVQELSGGMQRRLTIARSLINDPDLILFDEPTTGLDPQARHLLWDRLYRLKQRGATLVITTHYMDEAEQLCDRLVIMDQGKIVAEGAPVELIREFVTREVVELRVPGDASIDGALADLAERIERLPDRLLLYASDGDDVLREVHRRGVATTTALVRRATLEDVFLRLTGRSLVE